MGSVIPEMTNPMGKGWGQPALSGVEIDDTHAMMSERDYKSLRTYQWGYPSGVYPGKMWKTDTDKGPQLRWFCSVENDTCSIGTRFILVA